MEPDCIARTEAVLVLAIFTQEGPISEFLTLPAGSRQIDAQRFEVGSQLSWRLELKAAHAKALSGLDIGRNVINIDGLLGRDFQGAESFPVNDRIRFAGTDDAGIDTRAEVGKKAVGGFEVADMDGVGVGEEGEAIPFGQLFKKGVFVNRGGVESAIPDFGELVEGEVPAKTLS